MSETSDHLCFCEMRRNEADVILTTEDRMAAACPTCAASTSTCLPASQGPVVTDLVALIRQAYRAG